MTPDLARRNIRLIALFNLCQDFIPYSALAVLIFADIAGSFVLAAAAFSVVMLSSVLFEVPTGIVSDLVGRKRTMVLGALSSSLSVLCYIAAQDAGLIFVGAALGGLTRAFYSGNNEALLYDTLVDVDREADYPDVAGRTSSMFQAAGAASAIMGGIIAAVLGYRSVLVASLPPQILCIVVALLIVNPHRHATERSAFGHLRESIALIWRNPRLRALTAARVIGFSFGEVAFQFRAAFIERLWPLWAIGITRALAHFLAAFSFYFAGRVIRRFGERRIVLFTIVYTNLIDMVWITFAGILSPLVMSLNSLFFGVITISNNTLAQREFSPQHRATMGSVASLLGSFGFALVAIAFGWITDAVGPDVALMVALAGALSSVFLFRIAFRREGRAVPVQAQTT